MPTRQAPAAAVVVLGNGPVGQTTAVLTSPTRAEVARALRRARGETDAYTTKVVDHGGLAAHR
jgi:hypothetical protein